MIDVVNKPELSDEKYQTYGNVRDEHYNGNLRYENFKERFLFPMKDFVSFGTDLQSMNFISTISFKQHY